MPCPHQGGESGEGPKKSWGRPKGGLWEAYMDIQFLNCASPFVGFGAQDDRRDTTYQVKHLSIPQNPYSSGHHLPSRAVPDIH
jgi:hypothetical protein